METRTIPELLQVMLDREDKFHRGLCQMANILFYNCVISHKEYTLLFDYVDANVPERKFSRRVAGTKAYSFPVDEWPPRKEWLEKQIEYSKNFEE